MSEMETKDKLITGLASVLVVTVIAVFAGLLLGFPVKWIWNYVAPDVFGFGRLNFWQALGMVFLFTVFFRQSKTP